MNASMLEQATIAYLYLARFDIRAKSDLRQLWIAEKQRVDLSDPQDALNIERIVNGGRVLEARDP
jgi:hypothetical protein